MNPFPISTAFLVLCFMISDTNQTPFTGDVSINCGSTEASAAGNGRQWVGDGQPKLSSLLQLKGLSAASTATHKSTSADPVPHKTARLSRSPFSYVFQVNPGQKIIRLHFNHISYRGFKGSNDLFSVEAAPFTLLSNFSASLTAVALGVSTFTKEFVLTIPESQLLTITFSPESSRSQDTHAFINGIEFIPVPSCLSYFGRGDVELQVVGQKSMVYVDNSTALEIVHRLNIKEDPVKPTGDFDGIFPKWATQRADKMHNQTWKMPVDVGFRYLIRLHFSEMGLKKASTVDAVFKVLINEMVACSNTELVKEKRENDILLYMDYLVVMRGHKHEGKRDILISFQSYDEFTDGDGLLAGFEILKLSNPDDSLASPNPLPLLQGSSSQTIQIFPSVIGHRNASGTVVIVISLLCIIVHKLREIWEARSIDEHKPSARAERVCRRFSLAEIQLATRNFSDGLLIGRGGFGKVYKGLIDKGQMTVAVKRLKSNSQQGASEFLTEVEVLSELRHINVISLIGYCNEQKEKILVYEYMPRGTLADHLYKYARDNRNCSSLTWKQCLNICIGAARGLDYLHTGHRVIHRDVKASNILLDESFIPKLSDFGLAKHENEGEFQSHVSTKVKGTNGYLDPHYFHTCKLTRQSDAYAFGVVLLATVCGRPAVDLWVPEDERILTKWAQDKISKGEVDQIVASSLKEEMSSNSLKAFVEIAKRCLHDEPKNRPTMSQIVLQLEFALEQQDTNLNQEIKEMTSVSDELPLPTSSDGTNIHMQNPTLPPNRQIHTKVGNSELTSGKKQGITCTRNSPSRLRPWGAFWNRVKQSKKNALQLSETPKMEDRKEEEYQGADREFSNRIEPSQKNQLASLDTAKMEARKEEEFQEADITSSNRVETSNKNQLTLPDTEKMEARREEKFREADVPSASILDKEKLSKFDQDIIAAVWSQFSCSNKVGEGRFGSVYKVVLPSGQLVAVKRLSESSYTGFDECYNEILLLPNLQHQNIIKLLGHCCHKRYKFLVYEFMENTSLDTFIDKEKENFQWLLWPVRFKIITGIARGLVYLHQDSELRVIHRDLKLRNILLDSEMNPKISHFANARSLVESRSEFGNYTMPPESPRRGRLSVKPDVYSFGIIVLEILTGTRAWKPEHTMTIRSYAQNLWDEEKALDLVDYSVGAFSADEALRCIHAALLCTQWDPDQRPQMPSVLKLLNGDSPPHESQELSFSIWRSNSLSLGHLI